MIAGGRAAALVVLLVACSGPAPSPSSTSPPASLAPELLRYACGRFAFGPDILARGRGTAELDPGPAAAALRAHLATRGPDFDFLPDSGWILAGMDGIGAEFVAVRADRGLTSVTVENQSGTWKVAGWGDCQPRVTLAEGLGPAEWSFDLSGPLPGPETRTFDALVTEMSCASGRPADGRIVGPAIAASENVVLVMFAVRPLPGAQECPSNPFTPVTVDVGEPLGDRALLDGGRLPPGDPTKPRF